MNVALRPDTLNIISLCTGGGGLDLGVELAMPGARSVVLVEREAFSASHLVAAMQEGLLAPAPIWSDVTTFNGRPWRGIVDGVIGGIPCQPHSLAGMRLGEEDERDLWSDARRIIVQSGAWFVLIENVRGMVTSGGAERVWRDLRRLGFTVEAGLFTASEVGASHERERIFILAVADDAVWRWSNAPTPERCDKSSGTDRGCSRYVVDAPSERRREGWPEPIIRSRRDAATEPSRLFPPGPGNISGWLEALGERPDLAPVLRRVVDVADPDSELRRHRHDGAIGDGGVRPHSPERGRVTVSGSGFRRAQSGFRRVADGVANRIDRLRMLGNGVVPLEAAYALRTLVTRLAAGGSAGAAQLVRMMESATPTTELSPHHGGTP